MRCRNRRPQTVLSVIGPMCSGKSGKGQEECLKRPELYRAVDPWELIIFKPKFDSRTEGFYTRVGHVKREAIVLPGDPERVVAMLRGCEGKNFVALLDEAHFLGIRKGRTDLPEDEVAAMHEAIVRLAASGCPTVVAGLESDFARRIPPQIRHLLLDPRVRKRFVRAVCNRCGRRAQLTQRLTNGLPSSRSEPMFAVQSSNDVQGDRVETETLAYTYEPRCVLCHELAD